MQYKRTKINFIIDRNTNDANMINDTIFEYPGMTGQVHKIKKLWYIETNPYAS